MQVLEVPESMVDQHGAVSEEVAIAMATGACEKYGADYGLSVTGFADNWGTQVLPIGTIYLGYASPLGVWAKKLNLRGDRASNRRRAATAALDWMRRKLQVQARGSFCRGRFRYHLISLNSQSPRF